ncbi:unnamed protein product [Knipowitschia caucasica]
MFRPLQLLSSVLSSGCRTGALLSPSTVTLSRCRCASKAAQPWSRDMSTEDLDEEDQIQRVIDDQVKRHKSIKYHILRRKMRPLGPPERKLTWQAIDEIRYLKQEQPEEWTVARLAEGFSVSEDVILRILRSKFIPSSERKAKQDTQVVVKLKQQMLPPGAWVEQKKPSLPSRTSKTQPLLPLSKGDGAVIPVVQHLAPQTVQNLPALHVLTNQLFTEPPKHAPDLCLEDKYSTESTAEDEEGDDEDEGWDGLVFTEGDIEELMSTVKSSPVLKEGNEFFDRNGNFLYKI